MNHIEEGSQSYWLAIWKQFKKRRLGYFAVYVVILFALAGIYAPFLASSKPLVVNYEDQWYFPLFRYLFYPRFFTKHIDIFFNLMMFTFPLAILAWYIANKYRKSTIIALLAVICLQLIFFILIILYPPKDPASNAQLNLAYYNTLKTHPYPDWNLELQYMNAYARLNLILTAQQREAQHLRMLNYSKKYKAEASRRGLKNALPTLWQLEYDNEQKQIALQQDILSRSKPDTEEHKMAEATLSYIKERRSWLQQQVPKLRHEIMPLIRHFHWEDDAGGDMTLNQFVSWIDLSRINRKDLTAALIFGIRISLVVGIIAVSIALAIGIPIGSFAGFYGGTTDIIVSRLLEIWESMPTFFMLLLVVAMMQSKSIFLVIMVIGLFGWTGFSRYIRGEFFKQRNLPYVEACRSLGYNNTHIMFSHILPNAIPPLLTLLPFAVMGAITSEAGLSFLGLGEEGSSSWGVLMDEGRTAFPGESYLLWPPAILLTLLLIAIALVGDALRDALDPKMHRA